MKKICLLIDDNDMTEVSGRIISKGEKKGFKIEFLTEFNVGSDERDDLLNDELELDKESIEKEFLEKYGKEKIDLIAVDYDLEDSGGVNGLEVIRLLRKSRKRTDIILYSSDVDSILKESVEKYEASKDLKSVIKDIKFLLSTNILAIHKRDINFEDNFIAVLDKQSKTIDQHFIDKLRELPEIPFDSHFFQKAESVKNISVTPSQLIALLESKDNNGNLIVEELIERTLSYWQEMIDYES